MIPRTLPDLAKAIAGISPAIANHLWQSTLFALVAAGLALALRKNQARTRHWIWMVASLKFTVPLALLVSIGSHFAKPHPVATQSSVYVAMEDVSEPFALPPAPIAAPPAPGIARIDTKQLAILIGGAAWLSGAFAVLTVWCVRWRRIAAALHEAVPVREGRELNALRRLERAAGVRSPIALLLSPAAMEPGIFGIARPVLAWPAGISARLDDAQLDAVLAHEICHVRRRDNLTAAIHMLVEAIFWFHPLVWWMGARLVEERERACDEEVLTLCRRPEVYAESILKVCEFCVESPLACVSGVTGADLKKRIVQIMTGRVVRKLDFGRKLLLLTVGLAVVAVPLVLGQMKVARRMILAVANAVPSPLRTEGNAMMPLEEMPATGEIAEVQMPIGADAAEAKPFAFDVVSIRPAVPPASGGRPRIGYKFTDDGFVANSSLLMTLVFQYLPELQGDSTRIVGLTDWVRTIPWEIRAKVAESDIAEWSKLSDDPSPKAKRRQRATVDAMLAERFKLKTHLESRESAIYALVVSKGGPNLKPAKPDARAGFTEPGRFSSQTVTLGLVAQLLGHELGRPVIDKTGLTGNYNITLNWAPTQGGAVGEAAQAADSAAPSLFTAVQEQLGLKLEAQKGAVEHLVIDSAEKPSVDGAEVPNPKQEPAVGPPGPNATNVVPMAADAHPSFAVAAIKPHDPSSNRQGFNATGDRFIIRNEDVTSLMMFAYSIDKHQIVDLPDRVDNVPYDIEGTTDTPGEPNLRQQQEMIRKLLADRFQLKFHPEKRDLPVYAIQVAKGGPKLKPPANPDGQPNQDAKSHGTEVTVNVTTASIADFIMGMQFFLDRPLVDQTGLTGRYDFSVRYAYNDGYSTDPNAPPGIATAFQEQLGLKLQATKAPINVFVIDHVERPSEN